MDGLKGFLYVIIYIHIIYHLHNLFKHQNVLNKLWFCLNAEFKSDRITESEYEG